MMNKKLLAVLLAALMLFSLAGCGKKSIEGTWKVDDQTSAEYAEFAQYGTLTMTFKDGKLTMGLDFLPTTPDLMKNAIKAALDTMSMSYTIKSDTELEMVSPLDGTKQTIPYAVNGDKLTFGGQSFTRMK